MKTFLDIVGAACTIVAAVFLGTLTVFMIRDMRKSNKKTISVAD